MAKNLIINEQVYIPCNKVEQLKGHPTALYRTNIVDLENRSARVNLPGGLISDLIATVLIHRTVGIYIISIGDFETEETLINPLTKSILQFCRLIHEDDTNTKFQKIRSTRELERFVIEDLGAYKYMILIGHGSSRGIRFGVDGWVSSEDLFDIFNHITNEKTIISLCCQTGYKSFSSLLSTLPYCKTVIAPFHIIHGAIASQFCQTFLANHLLEGHTTKTAFDKSRTSVAGSSSFRLWQNGRLQESD